MPWWFWLIALIVVALLLAWVRFASLRTWAVRVFSRVAPSKAGMSALFASNWVKAVALLLVVGPPIAWGVITYIEGRGADKVRVAVAERNTVNVQRQAGAQSGV